MGQHFGKYFQFCSPTYIENWPEALYSLCPAFSIIKLNQDETIRLGMNISEFGESFAPTTQEYDEAYKRILEENNTTIANYMLGDKSKKPEKLPTRPPWEVADISDIRLKVSNELWKFQNGAFIRLGSRSPKDSWLGMSKGFCVKDGDGDPLRFILDCSERMYEDLKLALNEKYDPSIVIRQWMDFEPWQEFRCFHHNNRLQGISQYNYLENAVFDEIIKWHDSIKWAIETFYQFFKRSCNFESVIFDVIVYRKQRNNEIQWEVKLLEINPYFELTDPCLFHWSKPIDGFRYNK